MGRLNVSIRNLAHVNYNVASYSPASGPIAAGFYGQ